MCGADSWPSRTTRCITPTCSAPGAYEHEGGLCFFSCRMSSIGSIRVWAVVEGERDLVRVEHTAEWCRWWIDIHVLSTMSSWRVGLVVSTVDGALAGLRQAGDRKCRLRLVSRSCRAGRRPGPERSPGSGCPRRSDPEGRLHHHREQTRHRRLERASPQVPAEITQSVLNQLEIMKTKPQFRGSIIPASRRRRRPLCHLAALPVLIDALRAHGYSIVRSPTHGQDDRRSHAAAHAVAYLRAVPDSIAFSSAAFVTNFIQFVFFSRRHPHERPLIIVGIFPSLTAPQARASLHPLHPLCRRPHPRIQRRNSHRPHHSLRAVSDYKNLHIIVIETAPRPHCRGAREPMLLNCLRPCPGSLHANAERPLRSTFP